MTLLDKALQDRLARLVPPDLVARLPDVEAMTEVIRRLSGLHKTIGSFIPQYVADDESLLTRSLGLKRPGAFLFADVSGFTALSERLRESGGDAGAETLTLVINDYFSTMLEILAKSDGQLLKFAGDALLAFFPGRQDDAAPKAIRTGLRMQRAMTRFQPIQTPELIALLGEHGQSLTMSIGISYGELFEAYVGNSAQRDHLIQGRLPGDAMDAEGVGDKDDVIISDALAEVARRQFTLKPLGSGFQCVVDDLGDRLDDYEFQIPQRRRAKTAAIFDFDVDNLVETLRVLLEQVENVSRFVAPAVVQELVASGGEQLQSQNRLVVTMFVHVSGFAEMLEAWGDEQLPALTLILERYYALIQRAVSVHGGSITRSDPYQLGMKLLIIFGAPIANPDDPERAVATALELQRLVQQLNQRLHEEALHGQRQHVEIVQRIGITLGPVFAGEVGWRARREYTVMGDDVNLAARLMSKAEFGQTLISERIWKRVRHAFEAQPVEALQLKGKRLPVQAYTVVRAIPRLQSATVLSDTPFTGREWELQFLQRLLQDAQRGGPVHSARLVGEAGVGKSRIARQLAFLAERAGFRVAWSTCALRNSDVSTWSMLLAQLLDIQVHDAVRAREQLGASLAELNIEHLTPALAGLLLASAKLAPNEKPTAPQTPGIRRNVFDIASQTSAPGATPGGIFALAGQHLHNNSQTSVQPGADLWQQAGQRISTGEAIAQFLAAFTRQHPTLIVIDDLQREHQSALQILSRLLAETTPMRLLVVLVHEPDDIHVGPEPTQIDDLPETDAGLMAIRLLRADSLSESLRSLLWQQARGRPIYIEALVQALIAKELIDIRDGCAGLRADAARIAPPDEVRKLVISRTDRLTPVAQATLRAAAVLDEPFTAGALKAVAGFERDDELEHALDELTTAALLETDTNGGFRFKYGLTQQVISDSLPRQLRQNLQKAAETFRTP